MTGFLSHLSNLAVDSKKETQTPPWGEAWVSFLPLLMFLKTYPPKYC